MAEYIERKTAIRCVENQCVDGKMWGNEETEGTLVDAYQLMDDLSDIPAADVAPVVHGRWDDSFDGITPYCSICGQSHRMMIRTPNYCPNCGAKMIEGDG